MNKERLRNEKRLARNLLSNQEKIEKSLAITKRLICIPEVWKAKTVGAYIEIGSEVKTGDFLNWCLQNEKRICLPKCKDKVDKMDFCLADLNELEQGCFCKQPKTNAAVLDLDVVIVPGVSFDKEKNRLGYGKGFYDRYLKDKIVFKIGVLFSCQLTNELICADKNDIRMDLLITENEIIG